MDDVQKLLAIEEIKRVKARYFRFLDLHDWDNMASVLADDAVASYSGGKYHFEGKEAILDFFRRTMNAETFHSTHKCHHPEIDLVSDTEATGTWGLEDKVLMTDMKLIIEGAAFYNDTYVKVDGEWKIKTTGYKRVYETLTPMPEGMTVTASYWATGGQSTLDAG